MLVSLILSYRLHMGGLKLCGDGVQARTRGMTLMRMPLTVMGDFDGHRPRVAGLPALFVAA